MATLLTDWNLLRLSALPHEIAYHSDKKRNDQRDYDSYNNRGGSGGYRGKGEGIYGGVIGVLSGCI